MQSSWKFRPAALQCLPVTQYCLTLTFIPDTFAIQVSDGLVSLQAMVYRRLFELASSSCAACVACSGPPTFLSARRYW
jgi:hypothetical protein